MADKSLQMCHCGWAKVTTYHGLRTHQGKKGCTPKGSAIPDTSQIIFNTFMPKFTYTLPPFELQGPDNCFDEEMLIRRQILAGLEQLKDQTQKELMLPSSSNPLENTSPQMFHSENEHKDEPRLPAADMWQTQATIFGTQPKPAIAELTVKKENKPLFGSTHQPLQASDHGNKTRIALDSMIGAQQPTQQFANQTFSSQTSTAHTAAATNGKENKPLLQSPEQPFQSAPPRTQEFVQNNPLQVYSTLQNVATTNDETKQFFATPPLLTGNTSQKTFELNCKQQPVIKPATFNAQLIPSNTGDVSVDQNFATTLPNVTMFGSKYQSHSAFGWPTSAQQFEMTKPDPLNAQTTAASNARPIEMPSTNLLKDLLMSDGELQLPSLAANPVTAKENKPNLGSPQIQSTSFTAHPVMSSTSAHQPLSQILTTQPSPKTSEAALKEHKPVSSSKPPPSTKPTAAPQTASVDVAQSGPVTPKAAVQEESKQFFETPQLSQQSATNGSKTRRALDFSTGAQQAQTSMTIPTTTSQTVLPPVEDTTEIDREVEKLRQIQRDQIKAELQHKIQSRARKLSEIRSCVKACKGSLDEEWLEINSVFSDVIHVVEEARQRALQPLENRRDKLKRDSQSLIKKIQEDIEELEKAIEEVDSTDDLDVVPVSKLKLKDFSKWNVDTSFSFGTLQSTLSTMMEQIQQETEKLAALELERAPAFVVDVKLDPTTAHQWLVVSKDGKKVQDSGQSQQQQQLPLAVGRFDMFGSIVGANQFSSGRAYWEVQVGGKSGWDLGVASAKANRKGKLTLSPDKGYWAIVHYDGENYEALSAPPVCLQLKEKPQTVGVFLDYEEGLVSFYNVTNRRHIYSFTECGFDDSIFPYFSPHLKQNGKNSAPLVIIPVKN